MINECNILIYSTFVFFCYFEYGITIIPLWNTQMPYESNFIPTRMETTEKYVFIPTEFGVVHAVRTDGSGIAWSHKVSHSAVTSLKNAGDRRLIVMTMDGTVTCLTYP